MKQYQQASYTTKETAMQGTVIRNNTVGSEAFSGNGGVFVSFGSTLTMNGGKITGNTSVSGRGGGIIRRRRR